ncbi:hypothetical protein RA269_29925, partial [Pseudomonas syringae pv. tagetis]
VCCVGGFGFVGWLCGVGGVFCVGGCGVWWVWGGGCGWCWCWGVVVFGFCGGWGVVSLGCFVLWCVCFGVCFVWGGC